MQRPNLFFAVVAELYKLLMFVVCVMLIGMVILKW